jgi:hypothetical protein
MLLKFLQEGGFEDSASKPVIYSSFYLSLPSLTGLHFKKQEV